jgi:hypothetical protein
MKPSNDDNNFKDEDKQMNAVDEGIEDNYDDGLLDINKLCDLPEIAQPNAPDEIQLVIAADLVMEM